MPEPEPLFHDAAHNYARLRAALGKGAPGSHRARRPQDDVWDALCDVLGWNVADGDAAARKRLGKAVEALVAAGATASEVKERSSRYRVVMRDAMLTPESLVKHWAACAPPARRLLGSHLQPHPIGDEAEGIGEALAGADMAAAARAAMARLHQSMEERSP
jgi:hypothetical protein